MYRGSCLCGAAKYEILGDFGAGHFCQCARCRKASGSAFASSALVATIDFVVVQSDDALKSFSVNGMHRVFCLHCRSPIISRRDAMTDAVRVRLGTLDSPVESGPLGLIYTGSKANWFKIQDELPQYSELPPGQ